jgi:manganese transport protein
MATQLEPLFGPFAKTMLGLGLFSAGLSSSLTAPLATSYAVTEILGIKGGPATPVFRGIALSVILVGTMLALTGIKPISIIIAAQFANGLLLPVVAIFLLFAINQKAMLGKYTNTFFLIYRG